MIKITGPEQYKKCPWKNGKGETTELAINENGSLDDFEWRLSIASVVEDGDFSNFDGYTRNLILIEGTGLTLQHNEQVTDSLASNGLVTNSLLTNSLVTDNLDKLLSVATFDGGNKTRGVLKSGPINDFNLIVKTSGYQSSVETYTQLQTIVLKPKQICFIYALNEVLAITSIDGEVKINLQPEHLIQFEEQDLSNLSVNGKNFIIVYIEKTKSKLIPHLKF